MSKKDDKRYVEDDYLDSYSESKKKQKQRGSGIADFYERMKDKYGTRKKAD